jgi:creatinine amidohydrolase
MKPLFPAYRKRYLPAMTLAEIAALPDKAWAPVILQTGAIEQHGPHLPVAVDSFLGQVWVTLALPLLAPDVPCYVTPPITIGKSNEHVGFPGTVFISKDTLREQLLAIARQLQRWGFRHVAILNSHGGNVAVINYTMEEVRTDLSMRVTILKGPWDLDVSKQEANYGIHANEAETSWLLAAAPQFVDMTQAVCEYPARLEDPGELRPEFAPATFSWITKDISRSGIMGDAPAATAEKGQRWLKYGAEKYAKGITEAARLAKEACA